MESKMTRKKLGKMGRRKKKQKKVMVKCRMLLKTAPIL